MPKKPKKEQPLKLNTSFDNALKSIVSSSQHKLNMDNRQNLIDKLRAIHTCEKHHKKIFNCRVNPDYSIYYETCCKEFSDFIFNQLSQEPLSEG